MTRSKLTKIFANLPELETSRLYMRKITDSDAADMYEYSKREDVTRWLLWEPHSSFEQTARYIRQLSTQYRAGEFYDWGLALKATGKFIGTCGFTMFDLENNRAEIGYVLNPDYWHLGYASEAVDAVINYGFEYLSLNRIEARYMSENIRSLHVMEKCGMTFEGINRSLLYVKNEYRDIGSCSILYREWRRAHPDTGNVKIRDRASKIRELFGR